MKRVVILLIILLSSNVFAETPVSTGSVTRANIRLSAINGYSFVDFSAAGVLTDYLGYKLQICSVTNSTECISGYIKSAGTGQTYGPELSTNAGFDTDTGWTKGVGWTISDGKANFSDVTGSEFVQSSPSVTGELYRSTFDTAGTSTNLTDFIKTPGGIGWFPITVLGSKEYYFLAAANYTVHGVSTAGGHTFTLDNYSRRKVLTPSITGVVVVSSAGGLTQNWSSNTMSTATSYYDNAGYTYSIYPAFNQTLSGNDNILSYGLIDCENYPGMAGLLVTGTGNIIRNYTVVRCPGGAYQFDESTTLVNSIGVSSGPDITIAAGKTVTAANNLFSDSAKSGDGTYSDATGLTKWSTDPKFVDPDNGNFKLQSTSPAIDAGTRY